MAHLWAFDWYRHRWPRMILNGVMTADPRYLCESWASCSINKRFLIGLQLRTNNSTRDILWRLESTEIRFRRGSGGADDASPDPLVGREGENTLPPSFIALYLKMTKLCCFSQNSNTLLNVPSAVFTGGLLVSLTRAGLLVMRWGCRLQTWRWRELLQMLEVTAIGSYSHVGSQAFGVVRHQLVDVFLCMAALPRWSAGRRSTRQSSSASTGVNGTYLAWCPNVIAQNEPATVCLQPVLHDARTLRNKGCLWLKQTTQFCHLYILFV